MQTSAVYVPQLTPSERLAAAALYERRARMGYSPPPRPPAPIPTPEPVPAAPAVFKEPWFRIVDYSGPKKLFLPQVMRAVCAHFCVEFSDMVSDRRQKFIIIPRHVAMYLCKEMTPSSFPAIGRMFGNRDHTVPLYACRKIAALILVDQDLAGSVASIRGDLEALL